MAVMQIEITFRVVTPLFTGGVMDPDPTREYPVKELRAQTLKGLLRFWHRALRPADVPGRELAIFGSSRDDGGQSLFRLYLPGDPPRFDEPGFQPWPPVLVYLGYGPLGVVTSYDRTQAGLQGDDWVKVKRPWIAPGRTIKLGLRFGPRAEDEDLEAVMGAVWALAAFGGIGARSRRGWGSVAIAEVEASDPGLAERYSGLVQQFRDLDELDRHMGGHFKRFAAPLPGLPAHTAFSASPRAQPARPGDRAGGGPAPIGARVLASPVSEGRDWWWALAEAGWSLNGWRSHRSPGQDPACAPDHDLIEKYLQGGYTDKAEPFATDVPDFPKRVVFGLPHNYFFSSRSNPKPPGTPPRLPIIAEVDAVEPGEREDRAIGRRASPLMLSLKRVGRRHAALYTFLPARFLPPGAAIRLKPQDGRKRPPPHPEDDWDDPHLGPAEIPFEEGFQLIEKYLSSLPPLGWRQVL